MISPSQRPLPDNTQHSQHKYPFPGWDSNPRSQQASALDRTATGTGFNIVLVTLIKNASLIEIPEGCFPPRYHAVRSAWPRTEVSSLLLYKAAELNIRLHLTEKTRLLEDVFPVPGT